MVKIIVRNGKRFVRVGGKLVKISDKISERELVQWLVKHLIKPKRRKKGSKEPKVKVATAPMLSSVVYDTSRIAEREAKDRLDEKQKELDNLKLSNAIVNAVQHNSGIQQPALPAGVGQLALPAPASVSSQFSTPIKQQAQLTPPTTPMTPPRPPRPSNVASILHSPAASSTAVSSPAVSST